MIALAVVLAAGEIPNEIAEITLEHVYQWILFLAAVIGGALLIRNKVVPFVDKVRDFLDDWNGEPGRPGVPRRLGVMERIEKIEQSHKTLAKIERYFADVEHGLWQPVMDYLKAHLPEEEHAEENKDGPNNAK